MATIELESLSKWYGEVIGLNDVTAALEGGIVGLVGPNGAGKSTLMGLVMGQLRPSKGKIRVLGENPWNRPAVLSRIGYCPEGDPFWSRISGFEFVHFLAKVSGLSGHEARTATRRALEETGMSEHSRRSIGGYSKGMRQRLKIAQALTHQPRLLILDEPMTGADPVARHDLAVLFRRLAGEGVDILISSHVLHEVESLTRRILLMDRGRIVATGDVRQIRVDLGDRPHAIRIVLEDPRRLAASLLRREEVTALRILGNETLIVETPAPEEVLDIISEQALTEKLGVREIVPDDEGLEAVFAYLTERS